MNKPNRSAGAVAYSYQRFSHPSQSAGDSIPRQTRLRDDWCKQNKVPLDTSLVFVDKGKSAFKGVERPALSEFLRLVQEGRIAKGSYLILDGMDRLSRAKPSEAVALLLLLVNAGIRVVQLSPQETIYQSDNLEMGNLMTAIVALSLAHEESKRKSGLLGQAWEAKRNRVKGGKGVLTVTAPGWLTFKSKNPVSVDDDPEETRLARKRKLESGKFVLNKHAATVRRIFKMCIDGHGAYSIASTFNTEKVPTWGRAAKWGQGVILYTIRSRAAMGEYQPMTRHGTKNRGNVGEPIKGYYPEVVDEGTWALANAALKGRKTHAGRKAKMGINLFRGLLHDAHDGERMGIMSNGRLPVYVSNAGRTGSRHGSFPVGAFEQAILSQLVEVDPTSILPPQGTKANRVTELTTECEKLKARLAMRKAQLADSDDEDDPLTDVVRDLAAKLKTATEELNDAKREAASPLTEAWSDVKTLASMAGEGDEMRTRLRSAIGKVVEEVWVLVLMWPGKMTRFALVEVYFKGGGVRHYKISYTRALGGRAGKRAATWKVDPTFKTAELKMESLKYNPENEKMMSPYFGVELMESEAIGESTPGAEG